MLASTRVILIAVIVAVVGAYLYITFRVPPGVTPQGDSAETVAWIGLGTGIVGLLTAIVGLFQKIVEARGKP